MICLIPLKQDSNDELHMDVISSQNIVYFGFSSLGVYNWITLKYISGFSPKIYIERERFCFWKPRELEKKTEMTIYAQGNVWAMPCECED
jgi:hypothetical protein